MLSRVAWALCSRTPGLPTLVDLVGLVDLAAFVVFGTALLASQFILNKNLIRSMMEKQIQLPDPVWQRLNLAWAGFFLTMGLLNLYIAFNFNLSTWVNFKLFGGLGLMFAFVIAQSLFLSKYIKESE